MANVGSDLIPSPGSLDVRRVVAVTGSNTFIGQNLLGLLEDDPTIGRILSVDVDAPGTAGHKTSHFALDLTHPSAEARLADLFALEEVSVVVHLAFLGSPVQDTIWAHETESVGTLRVISACRRTSVRKLVMWSQTLLYGAHPTNPSFLTELQPLRARRDEPFFTNKLEAEEDARRFGKPGTGRLATVL